ncbi:MAG: hypothetical protein PHO63_02515 [Bacilli bacterium]|nr:hypothetical protein [Bacilli bacterium]MDD4808435.1 hypothetical protein [Bacilli bacterium]
MNKCNINFIERLGVDFSKINSKIYTESDINEIVAKYEVQGETINDEVSLEHIYGMHSNIDECYRFPEILDYFFCDLGDGYHTRAIGMLKYDDTNVITGLTHSFKEEPISLIEADNKKNLIMTNGMHRFLVLRLLYLHAKTKCKTQEEFNKLKLQYTIPVKKIKVDLLKTYCKYLIDLFQPVSCMDKYYHSIERFIDQNNEKYYMLNEIVGWNQYESKYITETEMHNYLNSVKGLENEYDDNYDKTGRSKLITFNDEKILLTDDELIEYTRNIIINSNKKDLKTLQNIANIIQKYESFKCFCQTYFIDIINLEKKEEKHNDSYKTK